MAFRPDRGAHFFGDPPAAAELHVARRHHALLRHFDDAVALLDQQAVDAAHAELAGEREPDRTGAGDQHRGGGVAQRLAFNDPPVVAAFLAVSRECGERSSIAER